MEGIIAGVVIIGVLVAAGAWVVQDAARRGAARGVEEGHEAAGDDA